MRNCTPHDIVIFGATGGVIVTLKPSGDVARVEQTLVQVGECDGIPIYRRRFGDLVGLPEPVDGVWFVVSALVAQAAPRRGDLLSPGELIRNTAGQPIGCRGLIRHG